MNIFKGKKKMKSRAERGAAVGLERREAHAKKASLLGRGCSEWESASPLLCAPRRSGWIDWCLLFPLRLFLSCSDVTERMSIIRPPQGTSCGSRTLEALNFFFPPSPSCQINTLESRTPPPPHISMRFGHSDNYRRKILFCNLTAVRKVFNVV